jgi:hypothetical protein
MKQFYFTITFLIFVVSFTAAQSKKTDREEAGLIGPVKSVKESSIDYSGDKIVGEGFMKKDGDLVLYDENGREIDRKPISDFGEAMGKMSRTYDMQGFLAESRWVDPKGKVIKKDKFNYSDGRLAETLTYSGAGVLVEKTVRNYDKGGVLASEVYYDPVKPVARTVYKYDDRNKLVEIAFFLADGRKTTAPIGPCLGAHRVTFEYNEKGQTTSQTAFENDGALKKNYLWKYDDKGNVAEYNTETQSSTVNFVYKYEFDGKGNWIRRIATGTSLQKGLTVFGKPDTPYVRSTITTREITYF